MAGETVLVIDDNQTNVKLLVVLLELEGYQVHAVYSAEQALERLVELRPALILLDLQLPGMDGLTLARHLRADPVHRDRVIVAVTAFAMRGDEARAREAGCDGYISKPIDTRVFPRLVAEYLAGGRRR